MNRKKIIVLISCVFVTCLVIIFAYNKSFNKNKHIEEIKENSSNKVPDMVSIMLETGIDTNKYELSSSNEYPTSKYEFNSVKSKCENGGTLTWNDTTNKLVLKTSISDKCYAYFDIIPPDVSVSVINNPATYGKVGTINCTGGSAIYDQKFQAIKISTINNKYTSCTLNYTNSTSKVNLASYIISLSGKTQGTGKVVNENGYRYEGKDPNNYVWFNNELWRIIGVFDSATHGIEKKNLVKIIRSDVLDGLVWSKSDINDWTQSTLNKLLNNNYYNRTNAMSSGNCHASSTAQGICDYSQNGIMTKYRGMIEKVTWHLGGYSTNAATVDSFYTAERGTTVYNGNATSTTGYIGLIYPSDYGYSVLSSSCARTTNLNSYFLNTCAGQSWMYGKGHMWTISPYSDASNYAFYLHYEGSVKYFYPRVGSGIRPVLYLKNATYKVSGNGTIDSPYILGLD